MKNWTQFAVNLFLVIILITVTGVFPVYADGKEPAEWTLAAMPLAVIKSDPETDATLTSLANYLPQLILDRLNNSYFRQIATEETINRQLYALRNERKKYFSEIKSAVLTRDAVFLKSNSQKEFEESVAKEDKKIADIYQKITENLLKSSKILEEKMDVGFSKDESAFSSSTIATSKVNIGKEIEKQTSSDESTNEFTNFFRSILNVPVATTDSSVTEFISLYKNSNSELFKVDSKLASTPLSDLTYQKAVINAGIEGLISGSITSLSDYVFVTIDLSIFPGAQKVCSISNVASFDDVQVLVDELSLELLPYILNSNPIKLSVNVTLNDVRDEETQNLSKSFLPVIRVDDFVISGKHADVSIRSGVHTVLVEANGYKSESITMNFSEHTAFNIDVTLQKSQSIDITFTTPQENGNIGTVYLAGIPRGQTSVVVSVDGGNILGEYVTADGFSSFFLLPEVKSIQSPTFEVNPNDVDTSVYIEKSRKRMYTSYGLLLMSLPVAFFSYGTYINKNNIWAVGLTELTEVEQWQKISNVSIGVSVGLGVNMLVQLGRYLYATRKVLPETVKSVKPVVIQDSGSVD